MGERVDHRAGSPPPEGSFRSEAQRFVAAADRDPDRVAVLVASDDGSRSTTYAQLRRGAMAVASTVAGHAPLEGPIATLVPMDERGLIAMIGVHLAGRVLTNFNRADPAAHVAGLARTCGAATLLCTAETRATAVEAASLAGGTTVVDLDAVLADPEPAHFEGVPAAEGQLATIHYTSGSTGTPKGTPAWHGGSAPDGWPPAPVRPGERPAFLDGVLGPTAINGAYRALAVGESVALYDLRARGGAGLPMWLGEARPTRLRGQTAMLRMLLQSVDATTAHWLGSLRQVSVGGERLDIADVRRFAAVFAPGCRLEHLYGFSEAKAVVAACTFVCGEPVPESMPPFRANPAFQLAFVDEHGDPVPTGEVGELVVRSQLVAHGYAGQPELTADRFRRHEDGTTSFATRDLGRFVLDGAFDLVGRADDQVKVRGFNVHLGTVEQALTALDGIREAAVVSAVRPDGAAALVAYVVAEPGHRPTVGALRRGLAATLTPASVPSSFHLVVEMPTTTRDKIDRAVLARSSAGLVPRAIAHVAPRDDLERRLHALVATVLGLDPGGFGVLDDLFDLGADSLSMEELLARIAREHGRTIDIRSLLRGPTVAALASIVRSPVDEAVPLIVPLATGENGVPVVLFGGGDDPALSMVRLGRRLAAHHPVFVGQHRVVEGHARPFRTVDAFAAAIEKELARLVPIGPCVLAGHSFGGLVAYETARRRRAAGRAVEAVFLLDTSMPGGRLRSWARLAGGRAAALRGTDGPPSAPDAAGSRAAATRRVWAAAVRRARHVVLQRLEVGTPSPGDDAYALAHATRVAGARFRARPYHGRVIVVRASNRGPARQSDPADLGWSRFAPAAHGVPVDAHHVRLVNEPEVAMVAAVIEAALTRPHPTGTGVAAPAGPPSAFR